MTEESGLFAGSLQVDDVAVGDDVAENLSRRYFRAVELTDGVVAMEPGRHSLTERIDAWVLHPFLGVPVFLLMMYLMFTVAINVGAVFIDFFDILFGAFLVDRRFDVSTDGRRLLVVRSGGRERHEPLTLLENAIEVE